jgi:MYXO-CTERM domain-containing protein
MKTNNILTTAILAAAGLALSSASARASTFQNGDLIMGFMASGGTGATTTVQIDLGDTAFIFRDATGPILNLASLGSILDSTYGLGAGNAVAWYERTDLRFGAIGTWGTGNPPSQLQHGDGDLTTYATKSRTSVGANEFAKNSTGQTFGNNASMTTAANNVQSFGSSMAGKTVGTAYALDNSAAGTTFEDFSPTSGNAFGGQYSIITQAFSVGTRGLYLGGTLTAEGALDLFRTASDPTGQPGEYASSAAVRAPEFQGTLLIDSSGNLSFDVSPVPEPATGMFVGLTGLAALVMRRRRAVASVA